MDYPLPGAEDTIVALATPPGRSAVAVIRLSGRDALIIAGRLIKPWPIALREATLCHAHDPVDGSIIDRLVVCCFSGPRSYTGEDTVEFSTHGGHVVPEILIKSLLSAGARQALPGEFTRRAVLNGKMDLVQAEAVGDLIDASSDSMRRVVLHQLDGGLSKQIENLREELLQIEALLVYDIDFPEEDDGPISRNRVTDTAVRVCDLLELLLETAPATELVRDGAIIVIAGRPNVGKSSLFNALIGEVRAIVTEFPGTTRDAIEARLQFGQWPVRLIDTAGLHSTQQIIERLGIEISERYIANAHVVLVCDDELDKLAATTTLVNQLSPAPVLQILTKCDQHASTGADRDLLRVDQRGIIGVSAQKRVGLNNLTDRVGFLLEERYGAIPIARPALTRTRQRIVVQRARDELDEFTTRWREGALPATIAAVHIRQAVGALDELIGAVDVDEILGRVFATFCVGK